MFNKALIFSAILISIVILCLFVSGKLWLTSPDRNIYLVRGIDVSHHQGDIDWQKVANDDIGFAYIKATEADDWVDSKFLENWNQAKVSGLRVGAYHYYSLAYPGDIQANNFVQTVPLDTTMLAPTVDLEYVGNSKKRSSKEEFQRELNIFINQISKHYNQRPILYTTNEFYYDYLYPEFQNYDIWIRSIYRKPNLTKYPNWKIWQYSPYGRVDGIEGNVDLNVLNATNL